MCSRNNTQDNAKRALDDAKRLAKQGDYEGALAKHIWFHDHALSVRPSYYGVRLSYALRDWIQLGEKYPKALEKLKSVRDGKTSRLLAGETNREFFHDVLSINEYLGETKATVELFKRIEAVNADFAGTLYDLADQALLQEREFALAKKYLGDPATRLAAARRNFEEGMEFAKTAKNSDTSRQAYEKLFTDEVVLLVTVLGETADKEAAKDIQAHAMKTLDSEGIRNALKSYSG